MSENSPCPAVGDLLERASDHAAHIAGCPRCQALAGPTIVSEHADPDDTPLAPSYGGSSTQLHRGSVCQVAFGDIDEYLLGVVVETDGRDAHVVALTDETEMATDGDVLVPDEVLGYAAVALVYVSGDVLAEQVHDILGHVGAATVESLASGAAWERVADGAGSSVDFDPRVLFRHERQEFAASFWEPARLLAEMGSFGALIAARRSRSRSPDPGDLDRLLGGVGRTALLERDELDIAGCVDPVALTAVLSRLHVDIDESLVRLLGDAVSAERRRDDFTMSRPLTHLSGSSRPRKRTASASKQAQSYLDAVWRAAR